MILDIKIKNYRSFKEEMNFSMKAESSKSKLDNVFLAKCGSGDEVRLLKAAMVFGANASGKSNLLKAMFDIIYIICHSKYKAGEGISIYDSFKFNSETDNKPVEFTIEFVGKDTNRYKYEISYDAYRIVKEELNYYPNKKVKKLFERVVEEDKKATIHKGVFGKDIDLKEIAIFHNQTLLSKFGEDIPNKILSDVYIYFKNIDVINAFSSSRIADLNREITKEIKNDETLFNRLKELIKFADTGIVSLNLQETNESDFKFPENISENLRTKILEDYKDQLSGLHNRFKDKEYIGSAPLPFDEESHGTNILYSLGGRMLRALENGTPLFVDEICTGLHLKLIQILVGLFQNERINPKNAQLIFTSHSINLLDKNMFRKDQIWFVEKDKYGESDLYSLQDFPDVREDTPFDKWYMAGKFGGLPNLKSLESLFISK